MAGEDRTATHGLDAIRRLAEEPFRFDFFQALRRLDCLGQSRPRIGYSLKAADDAVRLAQEPSLAFAPSTIADFEPGDGETPARLSVLFFGLFGPNGPLPLHLTEFARDRIRNHDDLTFGRFMDVFHHRMLSLFYRAWADAQPTVSMDRSGEDRFGRYVASLCGLGSPALRDRDAAPDHVKLHFAGRLACQTRHAEGLRALVAGYFRMGVEILEFVGRWLPLPEESRCRIGESPATGSLGRTLILGARIRDCQQSFRIRLGPMGIGDYERMLPGSGSGCDERLAALVRGYVGEELAFDVNLVLRKEEVPSTRLDGRGKLGWTTWLVSRTPAENPDDLTIEPPARAG